MQAVGATRATHSGPGALVHRSREPTVTHLKRVFKSESSEVQEPKKYEMVTNIKRAVPLERFELPTFPLRRERYYQLS